MNELKMESCPGKCKIHYQVLLFGKLLDRNLSSIPNSEKQSNDENKQDQETKDDEFLWQKGAWISLCVNLAGQIEYLGYLTLIW